MEWLVAFMLPYLIGSFSSAYFLGKLLYQQDLSKEGSGNLGAMNSFETKGISFGVMVFVLDVLKGVGAILLVRGFYGDEILTYLAAFGVILGHNYSIYIGFRGGKGLASMVGVLTVLNPIVLLVVGFIAAVFRVLSKNNGVAAMLAIIPYTLIFWLVSGDWRSVPFSLLLTLLILVKHRPEEYEELLYFLRLK